MMDAISAYVRLPHLFQGYVEFFDAAAAGGGLVTIVDRYCRDVPPRNRALEIVRGAFIQDRLFFYRVHGAKDWARHIDARTYQNEEGHPCVDFNLCKLLQLPGLAPTGELRQMAQFCQALRDVCAQHPKHRLYLNCSAPATRKLRKDEAPYRFELLANPMNGTGRLQGEVDPSWLAPAHLALAMLPAVRQFFERYAQESLRRRQRHALLDLDELFPFGDSPFKAYDRARPEYRVTT